QYLRRPAIWIARIVGRGGVRAHYCWSLPCGPAIMCPPHFDLSTPGLGKSTYLDEVGYGDVPASTAILSGGNGLLVIEVIGCVRSIKGLHVFPVKDATDEVSAMHTHAEAVSSRVMDGEIGVIEGQIIETTALQPRIAASEDMVDDGWSSSVRVCLPAVAREAKTRKAVLVPRVAPSAKHRGAESLGVVPAGDYEHAICASRYAGLRPSEESVRKWLLHIIDLPIGAYAWRPSCSCWRAWTGSCSIHVRRGFHRADNAVLIVTFLFLDSGLGNRFRCAQQNQNAQSERDEILSFHVTLRVSDFLFSQP